MKARSARMACCAAALFASAPGQAQTLQEALQAAYRNNPTITAQRANVRVADAGVPIARAAGLPTLEGTATYQENVLQGDPGPGGIFSNPDRQLVSGANLTMPVITFGAVTNGVRAAEARVQASRQGLRSTEAELFTAVVGAYMDVLRDEAAVGFNQRNSQVMQFTLREANERRQAGNRGPTDVAQSEARLSLAESQVETASARLIASREQYIRLVGRPPGKLQPPPPLPQMPATADEAVRIAVQNNPQLMAAQQQQRAAGFDVEVADRERYPRLNAVAGINNYDYLGSLDPGTGPRNRDNGTTAFVGVQLRVPFYDGGRAISQVRQAQARQAVAGEQVLEAERQVVADTRAAFARWRAAARVIEASQRGVGANERVLNGLRAETSAGFRPLLDRLNAEQELLNAQVTLVTARRDAYVAGFDLLAVMGMADAEDLRFETAALYDPTVNYRRVRNAAFRYGRDPAPVPESTGTAQTPAQDAAVSWTDPTPVPPTAP